MKNLRKWLRSKRGQTLIEYALILVLVVIVGAVVLNQIGQNVNEVFNNVNTELDALT